MKLCVHLGHVVDGATRREQGDCRLFHNLKQSIKLEDSWALQGIIGSIPYYAAITATLLTDLTRKSSPNVVL